MTPQSISVAITWPSDAHREFKVTVSNAASKHESSSSIDATGRGIEECGSAPKAEILRPVPRASMIRLAADPACRCQISRVSTRARTGTWSRLRFAAKWASRLVAACDGYAAVRDSVIPVATMLAALFFVI
jgi:hypothetical protein